MSPSPAAIRRLSLCLLALAVPGWSHNGAVATARHVTGIVVDGDLSDWPDGLPRHAIRQLAHGDSLSGPDDLRASFRVAYNPADDAIFVAVEVDDDTWVRRPTFVSEVGPNATGWNSQDGLELYLYPTHRPLGYQYGLWGDSLLVELGGMNVSHARVSGSGGEIDFVSVRRRIVGSGMVYELRLDAGAVSHGTIALAPGNTMGFDVVIDDKDDDGSFSWIAWGDWAQKFNGPERVGDLHFAPVPNAPAGRLQATVRQPGGLPFANLSLHVRAGGRQMARLTTDTQGRVGHDLRPGRYWLRAAQGQPTAAVDSVGFEIVEGQTTAVQLSLMREPVLARLVAYIDGTADVEAFLSAYETDLEPLLLRHGFKPAARADRLSSGSFARLYEVDSITAFHDSLIALRRADLGVGRARMATFAAGGADSLRVELTLHAGPVGVMSSQPLGEGRSLTTATRRVRMGPGSRRGVWQSYDVSDGMSGAFVRSMIQDRDGAIWLTAFGGISRFDGTWITHFHSADQLGSPSIQSVLQARDGSLWIGAQGGLLHLQESDARVYGAADGVPGTNVYRLLEDDDGDLWIASHGVSRFDGERLHVLDAVAGPRGFLVRALARQADGVLWFGTNAGIARYDGRRFRVFTTYDGLPHDDVTALVVGSDGTLWIGTAAGLARHDGSAFQTWSPADGLPHARVNALFEDGDGSLWIGTQEGLARFDGQRFAAFTSADGLVHNSVLTILRDREGYLWLGTQGGVTRYDGNRFRTFTSADGLPSDNIGRLLQTRDGDLWFASAVGGAARMRDGVVESFDATHGLPEDGLLSLYEDRDGHVWLGSSRSGVSRFDGSRFRTLADSLGITRNLVLSMHEDPDRRMWLGVYAGVLRYENGDFTRFEYEQPGASRFHYVADIEEDRRGRLWMATFGGVTLVDGDAFHDLTVQDGMPSNRVHTVLVDRQERVWAGTEEGLVRVDEHAVLEVLTEADGLAGPRVNGLLEDRHGRIWIATDGGVNLYDGTVMQTLRKQDGLANNFVIDLMEDRDGAIWMATPTGVTRYRSLPSSPPAIVAEVTADRRYEAVRHVQMSTTQRFVAFHLDAQSLSTTPAQMRYVYRLRGLHDDWRVSSVDRVEYQDLGAGDYLFEVKAVDRDLGYSAEPATVVLRVHWPVDRIALGLALVLAITVGAWQTGRVVQRGRRLREANRTLATANERIREQNVEIQEANRLKSDFLARMSHDLRTPMNAITGYTRILLRRAKDSLEPRQYQNLLNIQTSAGNLLGLINDILDLSRIEAGRMELAPEETDVKALVESCVTSVAPLVSEGVELRRELEDLPPMVLDPERLRRVVMNLLGNAVKFTERGSITLALRAVDDADGPAVVLAVTDTGIGIPPEDLPHIFDEFRQVEGVAKAQEGSGLGLSIARKSIELMGGTIRADSVVGEGTTFAIRLPGR